jgi:predicted AAA+ superfamily ATPase
MKLHRIALHKLKEWKNKKGKKPLIVRGARQVGKTTLVIEFAREYKQFIHINLEKPSDKKYFDEHDNVKSIIERLALEKNLKTDWKNTLLFIDEIQESPKSIHLLRYFYEDYPDLSVIAAGSLLEFALTKVRAFPVGRVEYLYVFPLNFEEFLMALGQENILNHWNQTPTQNIAHPKLLELFNTYAIIGGMPEFVKKYVNENSFISLPEIYESLWETYKNDVEKYASNTTEQRVIKHILLTAPSYLDHRVKFQNFGNSNYKSREVGEAFRKLDDAKLIQLIYPTSDIKLPLKPDFKKTPRMQFLDTGILNHALAIQSQLIGLEDLSDEMRGALIPHLVYQEILAKQNKSFQKPTFWVREKTQSSAEVDLLLPINGKAIPVEIKSGSSGKLRSLHQFMDKSDLDFAVRLYAGNISVENTKTASGKPFRLLNLPYYLAVKIEEYVKWMEKDLTKAF